MDCVPGGPLYYFPRDLVLILSLVYLLVERVLYFLWSHAFLYLPDLGVSVDFFHVHVPTRVSASIVEEPGKGRCPLLDLT